MSHLSDEQWAAAVRLLTTGLDNRAVARQVGCGPRAVARIRAAAGIAPYSNRTSIESKALRHMTEPDAEGHVLWTGRRMTSGQGVIRHLDVEKPVTHVAFRMRSGRVPVGMVTADCGVSSCVAGAHLLDDIERRHQRGQERALYGLEPDPWTECANGHSWAVWGRFTPALAPYCKRCSNDRSERSRVQRGAIR